MSFPEIDDLTLSDLLESSQAMFFLNPIHRGGDSVDLLPTILFSTVAYVRVRQVAHLATQGRHL